MNTQNTSAAIVVTTAESFAQPTAKMSYKELQEKATAMGFEVSVDGKKVHQVKKADLIEWIALEEQKVVFDNGSISKSGARLGRKVDPNSPRQQRLREMEQRRIEHGGEVKRGRPAVGEGNFVKKEGVPYGRPAGMPTIKKEGVVYGRPADPNKPKKEVKAGQLGRPVDPNSPRQIKLREQAERRAQYQAQIEAAKALKQG